MRLCLQLGCALLLLSACHSSDSTTNASDAAADVEATRTAQAPRLELLPASRTGVDFQNQIIETFEVNITTNINMYNGGGLAVGDFNNDGLQDLYFVSSSGPNRLYLNEGSLKFRDITEASGTDSPGGFETAATVADVNADGWADIYVCRAGIEDNDSRRNRLYINNKDLTFSEQAKQYGLDDMSASAGANFFDYDNDGDLDCYVLNYPKETAYTSKIEAQLDAAGNYHPLLHPRNTYDSDRLYRNDGPAKGFTDVSKTAGIWNFAYGLSVSVTDFNQDGFMDIYVGNDFLQPDLLYINNRNGTFNDRLGDYLRHTSQQTMGTDLSDFDGDGLVDILGIDMLEFNNYRQKTVHATNDQSKVTALEEHGYFPSVVRNVLQRNNGNGTFSDVACLAGVYKTSWSWSGLLFDMDNDGLRDMHISNGYRRDVHNRDFKDFVMPEVRKKAQTSTTLQELYPDFNDFLKLIPTYKSCNFCYRNNGDWTFADKGGDWMSLPASWSCGSAWADLDNDGDLELIVNNLEDPAFIYENKTAGQSDGNFLQVKLQGSGQNPLGVGASVRIECQGKTQFAEMNPTHGIFSSVEHLLHFGLGNANTVEKLSIRWPDGKTQTLSNLPANQRLVLKQADASGNVATLLQKAAAPSIFVEKTSSSGVNFTHVEVPINDFEQYPLNPWKVTNLGPALASGDVNGDGLQDFYIGNAFDNTSALYAQQPNGHFKPISAQTWAFDKIYEDHGALFFDADNDNDLDLLVVSGGAEAANPLAWQSRLYINTDGKGNFMKAGSAIPQAADACSRAAAYDYDGDGDQDLFIGARSSPGKWPLSPRSMVLRNDRTRFTDVTAQVAPEFERCGMVSDLAWANVDADPAAELVVCGEWMPIMVFKLQGGNLVNISTSLGFAESNGLWNRLIVSDLDKDGDMDLVTGNLGLNTRYTASETEPLRCYAKDFDNNGSVDPLMTFMENGRECPYPQRDVVVKQMPILKKKFLHANDYGKAVIDDLWSRKDLNAALQLKCNILETCWWENQGGKFVRHVLPMQAQVSVVQGIIADDFNNDGQIDLLLAGNKYGMDAETNRCDAGNGCLLLGKGKGQFAYLDNRFSGFWATREARDLLMLKSADSRRIVIVANNNSGAQVFLQQF